MDLTTTSEIVKIGLVLVTFFTIPVNSETCTKKELFGTTKYIYCETSCCGSSYNTYCCAALASLTTAHIVLIAVAGGVGLGVCIVCVCCCMRRRGAQGTVLTQQVPVQQAVFQSNMIPTAPGQIIQMQPYQTPIFITNQQPQFNPVIQPNMGPNPPVSTIASQNAHSNTNPSQRTKKNDLTHESSEPPAYEALSRTGMEKSHEYGEVDFKYRENSTYDALVKSNPPSEYYTECEELHEYSASNPNYGVSEESPECSESNPNYGVSEESPEISVKNPLYE